MAKVVIKPLNAKSKGKSTSSVGKKKVRTSDGRLVTIRTIDANSPTFGGDLLHVFKLNVARARRENKRLFGSPDRVTKRG